MRHDAYLRHYYTNVSKKGYKHLHEDQKSAAYQKRPTNQSLDTKDLSKI